MRKNAIMRSVLILGISGIIAKSFDFCFKAFYSRYLGSEGMGLLSLGFSLHGIMLTFSTAGLGVAVSKITSEYLEKNNHIAVKRCMKSSVFGVCLLSLIVIFITLIFSKSISKYVLHDERVGLSLLTLAPSVLFMGVSYCLKGYFYAARKTLAPASSEILEQCVKFICIWFFLRLFLPYGIEYGCAAVFLGISAGEFSSCLYLSIIYMKTSRYGYISENEAEISQKQIVCKLLGVSIPSMVTSLCCSALRMEEEVLIVSSLERGGLSHSASVQSLGILRGMAIPLLVLPLTLLGSVMSLLVPEISRAGVCGKRLLKHRAILIYKYGIFLGLIVGFIFFVFGGKISTAFYGTDEPSLLVTYLAPLCPVMFIDSLSCSILNGLGKQPRMLVFTLLDFTLRLSLIYFTLPAGGTAAYAVMTVISNLFTCTLSFMSVWFLVFKDNILSPVKLTKRRKCGIFKA